MAEGGTYRVTRTLRRSWKRGQVRRGERRVYLFSFSFVLCALTNRSAGGDRGSFA